MFVAETNLSSKKTLAPSGTELATIRPVRLIPVCGLILNPRAQKIAKTPAMRRTIAVVRVIIIL